jgi:putative serine protease PepD
MTEIWRFMSARLHVSVLCLALLVAGVACSTGATTGTTNAASTSSGNEGSGIQSQEDALISVIKSATASVVEIQTAGGLGSGVVFDDQGDIVTNSHVVGSATDVVVVSADGRRMPGIVVGSFPPDDLAVVRVATRSLKPATFADSSKVQVGQIVVAIGNPLGLQSSVTNGIVSATGRVVSESGNVTLPDTIQTSAPINPGNSGGALVDMRTQVIGIPTLAALFPGSTNGAVAPAPGIGFAIASNRVKDIAGQLAKNGRVIDSHRAFLGVSVASTSAAQGVAVVAVQPGGPADTAGIRPGDVIVAVDGKPTPTSAELSQVLAGLQPVQTVNVAVQRDDGTKRTLPVKLGQFPG